LPEKEEVVWRDLISMGVEERRARVAVTAVRAETNTIVPPRLERE
jgi:hypothetical protein